MPITVNGVTYSDQQIKDFTANSSYADQVKMANNLGFNADQFNEAKRIQGGGIYTDPNEFAKFEDYLHGALPALGNANSLSFDTWRAKQDSNYLAKLHDQNATGYIGVNDQFQGVYGAPGTDTAGAGNSVGGYGSGYGGGYGSGSGGSSSSSYSSTNGYAINPYLDQMAASITNQMNENWNRNLAPSIRSGAMAAGGFGGSRQGVVEANGLRDLNQTLGNSLANLYGTGWQNQQQNSLQNKSLDNSYSLGVMNNNLGYANLDSNNAQFGANLALNTLNAQNQWAQNGVNAANQMYQMPLQYQQYFNNMQNNIAGQGGSTSQQNQGNPALGFLGGAQLANSWFK